MLVPERMELLVELLDLPYELGITPVREPVPELSPTLAQRVDLCMDGRDDVHAPSNEGAELTIPVCRG